MKNKIILIGLIILLVGNVIFWGSQKEGFHVDEMFSYEQIGNTDYPKPELDRPGEPCLNTWHNREYYEDYLIVDSEEAYNLSAFYNSASVNTAHPPLYLTMFGMFVSAFFQNHFTKWSGIAFNIFFYILTLLVFFDLAERVLKKEKLALFSVFLCGVCVGTVSTVIFIRDYMMLTFVSTFFLDLHVRMLDANLSFAESFKKRIPEYLGVFLLLIIGSMIHYYFIVFAFFVCVGFWVLLLLGKKYRWTLEHFLTCVMGILAYYILWPNIIRDLLSEARGTEAINNLVGSSDEYWAQLGHYIQTIDNRITAGVGMLVVLIILIALLVKLLKTYSFRYSFNGNESFELVVPTNLKEKNKKTERNRILGIEWLAFFLAVFSTISYILLITKIAPVLWLDTFKDSRYILNIFPCLILMLLFFLDRFILRFFNNHRINIITWLIVTVLILMSYLTNGVDYLYKGADRQLEQLSIYSEDKAVFISEVDYLCSNLNVYFTKMEAVYQTNESGLSKLSEIINTTGDSEILVYVSTDTENDIDVVSELNSELNAKGCEYLFETVGRHTAQVYLIKLQ